MNMLSYKSKKKIMYRILMIENTDERNQKISK